jgi:hypothetical protein
MMTLIQILDAMNLEIAAAANRTDQTVAGGYASDLLSCVMGHAKRNYLWVTLQAHVNVIAVASLRELAGVIITEGQRPDAETLERAEKAGVVVLLTPKTTFSVVGELAALGVNGEVDDQV